MATLLIIVIYAAFIGLGIPDSLFGPAWPVMHKDFGLDVSLMGYITPVCTFFTIISSLLSAKLINRFGTARVTAVSTAMTALALLGYSLSPNIVFVILCSIPLGLGGGAIDSGLNNYVALHYNTATMSFLHCFYGIGVSLSPYLMSIALDGSGDWRGGYRLAFFVQLGISLLVIFTIPIWKKAHPPIVIEGSASAKTMKLREVIRVPGVLKASAIFVASCAIEYVCGAWGSTFLVESKGVTPADAAQIIVFYYVGMALGRFLSGVLAGRLACWRIIELGEAVVAVAVVLLLLPLPTVVSGIALFMVGLGNGPVFPNLVHLTPRNFGLEISGAAMGVQMAAAYTGIMLMPMIFGALVGVFSTDVFAVFLAIVFVVMVLFTALMVRFAKKGNKYE